MISNIKRGWDKSDLAKEIRTTGSTPLRKYTPLSAGGS